MKTYTFSYGPNNQHKISVKSISLGRAKVEALLKLDENSLNDGDKYDLVLESINPELPINIPNNTGV